MKPAVRFAFMVGTLVSLAAAATGIIIYASHPSSDFYLLGWDELEHRSYADVLLNGGSGNFLENVLRGQALTGNATWGIGLMIAICRYLLGSDLPFMALKWALHVLAAWLLYQLVRKYRGERVAGYVGLFFLMYPPLLVYEASFLKDDLVAAVVVITAATIDRRWFLVTAALLVLMIAVRANAVLFPLILIGYLRGARLRYVLLAAVIPVAAVAAVAPGYIEHMQVILSLPPATVLFFTAKYLLGPLPTNILGYDTEAVFIFPWYTLSFLGVVAGFFLPGFYASVRANWRWILLLLAACLGPYLPYVTDVDIIGPRQFSTVGWLYFLLFYERVLRYGFTLGRPRAQAGGTWSPAT
jgi:hypothetical protein